ncbi:carbohydrate-binding module family 50 protein [Xylariaceae sp. FL0662B]|nr:carbohydrate-binding module family 50 protein [Xylariaceae sp. FL0662B]
MGRWSHYDTDEERLPEGMQRIGYDADTQTYTFRDADGSIWESAPGNQYGPLFRVSTAHDDHDISQPVPHHTVPQPKNSWRREMMPLLNWFLLVGLFLLIVFWFIISPTKRADPLTCGDQSTPYKIKSGDTCWAIAEDKGVSLEALMQENQGLNCDKLAVGGTICVPRV